jgi:transketolase
VTPVVRDCVLKLLEVKDSQIRISALEQAWNAVDHGIHAGGAFSAVIPLVSLYYGGVMDFDVEHPTRGGQDLFVLSKGHAVAPLASIYADLGYFEESVLANSRSWASILNGHPGPLLPGVHISTGPLGHGVSVASGFALAGRMSPHFDVFCLTGDGELQEGSVWEGFMYASRRHLDNLCVLVDMNRGQLDSSSQLVFPMEDVGDMLRSFGWTVDEVDGTQYGPVWDSLVRFRRGPRNGKPAAVVCRTWKGFGAFSRALDSHKMVVSGELRDQELRLQRRRHEERIRELAAALERLDRSETDRSAAREIGRIAEGMRVDIRTAPDGRRAIQARPAALRTKRATPRDKRISYDASLLPRLEVGREYSASSVVTQAMGVFARDPRVVSIDADLSSTSGLAAGVGSVDQERALNVGVAEANMMNIGEGFAALGCNVWVSTFCPFFDWRALRRIAVGYQERLEAIESGSWLSEGHGLDLTFLATAPNFETVTNGATHMGNDDTLVYSEVAGLKIIDVCCPNQLLGAMRWVMEGNKGLVYLRMPRAPFAALYGPDYLFEYGKGRVLAPGGDDGPVIVSSGRGVVEALGASRLLAEQGVDAGVVDMPSIDEELLERLCRSGGLVVVAEQNNGYILKRLLQRLFVRRVPVDPARILAVNASGASGEPRFIHSATYAELTGGLHLSAPELAVAVRRRMGAR